MRFAATVIATVAFVNGSVEGSLANSKASSENTNFHDTIATNNDRNSNVHGRIQRRTNMNMAMMRNSVGNRKVRRRISAGGASGVGSNIDTARVPDYMVSEDTNEQSPAVPEQDIIDGTWLLYSLQFEESVHTVGGSDYQGQVNGLFCKIDLSAQKEDPSKGKSIATPPTVLSKQPISPHLHLFSPILYQLCPWSQVWPGWKPCEPQSA